MRAAGKLAARFFPVRAGEFPGAMRADPTRPDPNLHERIASGPLDARRGQRNEQVASAVVPNTAQVEPLDVSLLRKLRSLQIGDAAAGLADVAEARRRALSTRYLGRVSPGEMRAAYGAPDRDPLRALLVERPYPGR